MKAHLTHFAINADDIDEARQFYESVMGWTFSAWGPSGFFKIATGTPESPGVQGALQSRRELVPGKPSPLSDISSSSPILPGMPSVPCNTTRRQVDADTTKAGSLPFGGYGRLPGF